MRLTLLRQGSLWWREYNWFFTGGRTVIVNGLYVYVGRLLRCARNDAVFDGHFGLLFWVDGTMLQMQLAFYQTLTDFIFKMRNFSQKTAQEFEPYKVSRKFIFYKLD